MNDKDRAKLLRAIREVTRQDTRSVEAANEAFVRSGIYTKNGDLSVNYGGVRTPRRRNRPRQATLSA